MAARKHYLIISLNFLLLLSFIPLSFSFIPLDHPRLLFSLLVVAISFKVFGKLQIWLIPFIFLLLKCYLLSSMGSSLLFFEIKSVNIIKLRNSLTSSFAPSFIFLQRIFFHLITFLPKVPYTLIKLLQFFWGLWINLHLFSLVPFDLLLLIV